MPDYDSGVQLPIGSTPKLDDMEQELIDIHNSLHILAALLGSSEAVASDTTLDESQFVVLADTSAAARTLTLPPANSVVGGKRFYLKVTSSNNSLTVATSGSDKIDGLYTSAVFNFPHCALLVTDNVGWWII